MTKAKRVELVMNAIKQSSYSYKVLDEKNGIPVHVRVEMGKDYLDVWPATGTFGSNGKYARNDINGFIKSIGVNAGSNTKTNSQRITDLEEYCAYLEYEINQLKGRM